MKASNISMTLKQQEVYKIMFYKFIWVCFYLLIMAL